MTPAMVLLMQRLSDGEVVDIMTADDPKMISFQMRRTGDSVECRQWFQAYDHFGKWWSLNDIGLMSLLQFASQQGPSTLSCDPTSERHIEI